VNLKIGDPLKVFWRERKPSPLTFREATVGLKSRMGPKIPLRKYALFLNPLENGSSQCSCSKGHRVLKQFFSYDQKNFSFVIPKMSNET